MRAFAAMPVLVALPALPALAAHAPLPTPPPSQCDCGDRPSLCAPIDAPLPTGRWEVVANAFPKVDPAWNATLDYTRLTVVTVIHGVPAGLVCAAHAQGARVLVQAGLGGHGPGDSGAVSSNRTAILTNATLRAAWAARAAAYVAAVGADGIALDIESNTEELRDALTVLVRQMRAAQLARNPHAVVGFAASDVPLASPKALPSKFDYPALAGATEFFFLMCYAPDEGRHTANPGCPLPSVARAVAQYASVGVPASQLVLGVGWYGWDYACDGAGAPGACARPSPLARSSRRAFSGTCGVATAGPPSIVDLRRRSVAQGAGGERWDNATAGPYFNYRAASNDSSPAWRQVWYENEASVSAKVRTLRGAGARGAGMFLSGCVNITDENGTAMWAALSAADDE